MEGEGRGGREVGGEGRGKKMEGEGRWEGVREMLGEAREMGGEAREKRW